MRTVVRPLACVFACAALALTFAAGSAHAQAAQGMQARELRMLPDRQFSKQPNQLEKLVQDRRLGQDDGRDKSTGPNVPSVEGGDDIHQIDRMRREAQRMVECERNAKSELEKAMCRARKPAASAASRALEVRRDTP